MLTHNFITAEDVRSIEVTLGYTIAFDVFLDYFSKAAAPLRRKRVWRESR